AAGKAHLVGVSVALSLVGQVPAWLVVLVILRDCLIIVGFVAIQNTGEAKPLGPLMISKINTLVQLTLVGFVLAQGIGVEIGWLTSLLILAAAATTVGSGLSYLARLARTPRPQEPAL